MKRKIIKEYRYARLLHYALFEQTTEEWLELPIESRIRFQFAWNTLREREEIGLHDKAKAFKSIIYFTLFLTIFSAIGMMALMTISNGSDKYYYAIVAFEVQMMGMLMFHLFYVSWRWFWSRKLEWLALSIPIELQ